MINGQVDGSQSYWPPLDVHAAHRTPSLCHFPLDKATATRSSRQTWCFFFLKCKGAEINNPLWGVLGLARHHQRQSKNARYFPGVGGPR